MKGAASSFVEYTVFHDPSSTTHRGASSGRVSTFSRLHCPSLYVHVWTPPESRTMHILLPSAATAWRWPPRNPLTGRKRGLVEEGICPPVCPAARWASPAAVTDANPRRKLRRDVTVKD